MERVGGHVATVRVALAGLVKFELGVLVEAPGLVVSLGQPAAVSADPHQVVRVENWKGTTCYVWVK